MPLAKTWTQVLPNNYGWKPCKACPLSGRLQSILNLIDSFTAAQRGSLGNMSMATAPHTVFSGLT